MTITYQTPGFKADEVHKRYVRYADYLGKGVYKVILTRSNGATIQEAFAEGYEIQEDVRQAADKLKGQAFGYVEWPL